MNPDPYKGCSREQAEDFLAKLRKNREAYNAANPNNPAPLDSHEIVPAGEGLFKIQPKVS